MSKNPFRMPTDEEVFIHRDAERQKKLKRSVTGGNKTDIYENSTDHYSSHSHSRSELRQASEDMKKSSVNVHLPKIEHRENDSMTLYIEKKREMGLARMSLATKRQQIKKLDEDADRSEKRLRQKQEQLQNTHSKFNDFLRQSNMEQDAAVKRADIETKAKQEKMQEVKKLNGQILLIEIEKNKNDEQMKQCTEFKEFLDRVTPPQWFRDTLISLLIEDEKLRISSFLHSADDVNADMDNSGSQQEEQMAAELAARIEKATSEITETVDMLSPEAVREHLDMFDTNRVPMYFTNPQQILGIFFDIEESNLFLIQNCQELEEEIESISQAYQQDQAEMVRIAHQRKSQMETVSNKIVQEEGKLKQLIERLERANDVGAGVTQDQLKTRIEEKVKTIFRTIGGLGDESNMDTLGMLTFIETKLEEMHHYIINPANGIEESFAAGVMKQRDKERRRDARQLMLRKQAEEREARSKIAMERSKAPVIKRIGKPVMWRSKPLDGKETEVVTLEESTNEDDEFFS
eukprot:Tbor_TRINITY_DN5355_c4_g2::TRINITY_DN5355_c4_g2_i1::g.4673::m.4673